MNAQTKVLSLRKLILENLSPLIRGRVALFGLPCHGNTGDTYIAMGEFAFLQFVGAKVIYKKMLVDSTPLPELPEDCTILLQGGGDFGDVWRGIQKCRLSVLQKYRNHRIVIFPQSVHYQDESLVKDDANLLSECHDLTICARDSYSYTLLKENFRNKILLVPDMAFFIPSGKLKKYVLPVTKHTLFLKRVDKEHSVENYSDVALDEMRCKSSIDVSDWPTVKNDYWCLRWNLRMVGITDAFLLRKMTIFASLMRYLTVLQMVYVAYPIVSRSGVLFLSAYKNLYLTRLHSAILAVLLGKDFVLLDNSYHKNRSFYHTWLADLDGASYQSNNGLVKLSDD